MSVLIYDIMPPKRKPTKRIVHRATRSVKPQKEDKLLQIVTLLLAVGVVFNWAGFSGIVGTIAYLSDIEESTANVFSAGALDFVLDSPENFIPSPIAPGESASREINFLNNFNFPKYKVRAEEFTGEICDYLMIEASLDGGTSISMKLTEFVSDIVDYSEPDLWAFKLTLPTDAPESVQGQVCDFKFLFDGSQIKNDLPFGMGFNDVEDILNTIKAKFCKTYETRTMGYWKNHEEIYIPILPVCIGATGEKDLCLDTQIAVEAIFAEANADNMSDMLRAQLLTMKFNIKVFGIGEYIPTGDTRNLNEIVAYADEILRDPLSTREEMGQIKTLLDNLNNLHEIFICFDAIPGEELELASEPEPEPISAIVINEFLPNPIGNDKALMPDGEYVELYNTTDNDIDVAGWWLYDSDNAHELEITNANTNTGNTIVSALGRLVVFRNGDNDFTLNNEGGDMIRLYDKEISAGGNLIDSYTYTVDAPEGKSFARIPDGSDNWVDPLPTPGAPNVLEGEDVVFGPAIAEDDETESIFMEIIGTVENFIEEVFSAEPASVEQVSIEPISNEPAVEEPVIEEPIIEEPVSEEPAAEESVNEEISSDPTIILNELISEPVIVIEPVSTEPISEESIINEPVIDETLTE